MEFVGSPLQLSHPTRIAIVGCGNVGATYAYALLQNRLSSEIVLIDTNRAKAEGETMKWTPGLRQANKTLLAVRCKMLDGQEASIACCPPVGEAEAGSGGDQPAKE